MSATPSPDAAAATTVAPGRLARMRAAHFHDYTPAALRWWLLIAGSGALALTLSLGALAAAGWHAAGLTLIGLALVAAAAWFPVRIPRTKYSIGAADAIAFAMLAYLGPASAVLAAGLEGVIGAWRGSRRLSSRVSTPAAGMAGMAGCGLVFVGVCHLLSSWGVGLELAKLVALLPASMVAFALPTLSLMALMTLKHHRWPDLRECFLGFSWLAGVVLASALFAGVVQLVATHYGWIVFASVAAAALAVVALLRVSIAHQEAEHRAQEARIADARHDAELNQRRFAAAFTHAAIGMAIVNAQGRVVRANLALCSLLGRSEAELAQREFAAVLHPSDAALFERQSRDVALRQDSTAYSIELRCKGGDGRDVWVSLHCGRFNQGEDVAGGLIYQLHDITSRQAAESRLQHIAYHDSLTDLPNRACFHEQLELAVEDSRLDSDVRFAVLFLDLDRFKVVNDSLGHYHGNELLRDVARRLQQCLRPTDLVARLGGDEFAVLLRGMADFDTGMRLAERILAALCKPVSIGGTEIVPTASVGITFSDLGYRTADELLRDADVAMYEAKAQGRGRLAVFDRSMHERIADKLALEADLRHAIGEGELSLMFQPLFEIDPLRMAGFEALARWTHPTRGTISPAVFIALAEEAGHIEALTAWVLDKSLEQMAAWHRAAPHQAQLGISVNISGRDLSQPGFVERVHRALAKHGVAPNRLTLEITETVLMRRLDQAREAMQQLHHSGVRLAIDDFGTGYSSLAYLSTLPIDSLKIDRSFVAAMDQGHQGTEIVRAILTLGVALGKKVVAEGIETVEQLNTLRGLGVHVGQGYLLSRPLRPDQVPALLYVHTPATLGR